MIYERAILLAKAETVYGQNPTPAAADDAFTTTVPVFKPLGQHRAREVARMGFPTPAGVNVGEGLQVEFSVELRGTDYTADASPKIFRLFEACGMTTTTVSLITATLKFDNNHDGSSVAFIVNYHGTQHLILGARGSWTIDFVNNDVVMVNFIFMGIYAGNHASAVAFPSGTFEDTVERLIFRSAALTFNSVNSLVFENITLNPNLNVFRRPGSNSPSGTYAYSVSGRSVEASFEPEAVALATLDPWSLYNASTEFDVEFGVADDNDTPGQQYTFRLNNCLIHTPPEYGQRESLRTWPISIKAHASIDDGTDDFEIECTLPAES